MTTIDHECVTPACDKIIFSASDVEALIHLGCKLTLRAADRSARIIQFLSEIKHLLRAESACVFESRDYGTGSMLEVHRDAWRDWHSDALSNELTGRPVADVISRTFTMKWVPCDPLKTTRIHHSLASCFPAGANYLITLAFVRRAQAFTDREVALLETVQRSELIGLISPTRAPTSPELTRRMRQVLSRLMEGESEKQIAIHLTLSRHTIHQYVKLLYRRYGVHSRGELLSLSVDPVARQRLQT